MSEIECVRENSASSLLDGYFSKLIKEVDSKIKFVDWNSSQINSRSALILLVDNNHIKKLKEVLANRSEKVIVAFNSREDFKIVSELKSHFPVIFGFIDTSLDVNYNVPILKNYLNSNFTKHALRLDKLASDLDKVYEFTKSELTKVKDLHDRFVKVRLDQFKGASLTSKFMAGEKSGGEFFDIIQNDQEVQFIQAGSDSYLLSSIILGEIESLREKAASANLQTQAEQFQKAISNHAKENNAEVTFCIMSLNLKTLDASFVSRGQGRIFYQGELMSIEKPIKLKLKPKDRICIISEGSMKNWEFLSKLQAKTFFIDNQSMNTKDLINEFFFEVSRNKAGNFLIYDAFLAVLDIEENVLYQI